MRTDSNATLRQELPAQKGRRRSTRETPCVSTTTLLISARVQRCCWHGTPEVLWDLLIKKKNAHVPASSSESHATLNSNNNNSVRLPAAHPPLLLRHLRASQQRQQRRIKPGPAYTYNHPFDHPLLPSGMGGARNSLPCPTAVWRVRPPSREASEPNPPRMF